MFTVAYKQNKKAGLDEIFENNDFALSIVILKQTFFFCKWEQNSSPMEILTVK